MTSDIAVWFVGQNDAVSYYPPMLTPQANTPQSAYNGAALSRRFLQSAGQRNAQDVVQSRAEERAKRERSKERYRDIHKELISQTTFDGVLEVSAAAARTGEVAHGHAVTALHRSAKLSRGTCGIADDSRWKELVRRATNSAAELPPMSLALTVWALATAKCADLPCLSAIATNFPKRLENCKPHDLSGVAWAFASLEVKRLDLFESIANESIHAVENFLPQDLSMVSWAFARILIRNEPLFAVVASATISRHQEFAGQNLANTMWAFGTAAHHDEPFFTCLARMCVRNISTLGPVELSTALWSCASVAYDSGPGGELFSEAIGRVRRLASELEPQQLCSIAWSFARIGFRSRELFTCVADQVVGRSAHLEPSEINRFAWAFAFPGRPAEERTGRAGGFRNPALLQHISSEAMRKLDRLDPLQASSVAWAFATLSYRDSELLGSLASCIVDSERGLLAFEAQNICYLCWALGRLRVPHPALTKMACNEACRRGLDVFDHRHLSMLLWGMARLGENHQGFWDLAADSVPDIYSSHIADAQGVASLAMVIHALHQAGRRPVAIQLLEKVLALGVDISGDTYGGWLAGCQDAGDSQNELLLWEHMAQTAPSHGLRAAASNKAAIRALEHGFRERAIANLRLQEEAGVTNAVSAVLWERLGGMGATTNVVAHPLGWKPRTRSEGVKQARAAGRVLCKWDYYKEVGVLEYVFARASAGDPDSVCRAIEAFSREEHLYLKLGAEEKGLALDAMLQSVSDSFDCPPLVVEIGCYVGYSSVRMSSRMPAEGRLVTIEVDPYHAAIARSILELSGMNKKVEVWIGHSEHLIPRLAKRFGPECTHAIFFDQKGTRYHEDLDMLENGLLAPGAFVCGDNVVRPGAPEFMWRVCHPKGLYETQSIAHRDYGQDSVEDWVSISRFCPTVTTENGQVVKVAQPPQCPDELQQLAYESDQIRNRSINERVTEEEWRIFATRVRQEFHESGIRPTVLYPKGRDGSLTDLCVELEPWRRLV